MSGEQSNTVPPFAPSRWTRHTAHAAGLMLVSMPTAVTFAVYIMRRWDLLGTSGPMALFEGVIFLNGIVIIWLWDRRRYPAAWLAATVLPALLGFGYVRVLEDNPAMIANV